MANTTKLITVKINLDTLSAEDSAKVLKVHIQQLKDNVEKAAVGTKKHDAALERLNATLKKTGASTKRVTQETNAEAQAHKNSSTAIQREIAEQKKIQSTLDVTSTKYKQTTLRIAGLNAKMNQSSSATGLASSSALEFGRVISDAPYGIRGVANNVSQLASQLSYAAIAIDATTGKAIGFTGAMKNMWAAMMGPLGILLAIQTVIAALDYFAGSTKKAEEGIKDLTDSGVTELTTKLYVLDRALKDSNVSLENKAKLVKDANEELGDLNLTMGENGELTEDGKIALENYVLSLEKTAQASAAVSMMTDLMKEQMKAEILGVEGLSFAESVPAMLAQLFGDFSGSASLAGKAIESNISEVKGKIDGLYNYIDKNNLFDSIFGEKGKGKEKAEKAFKVFKASFLDFQSQILALQKSSATLLINNELDRLDEEAEYEQKAIDLKLSKYVDNLDRKLELFLQGDRTEEERIQARVNYQVAVDKAELDADKAHDEQKYNSQVIRQIKADEQKLKIEKDYFSALKSFKEQEFSEYEDLLDENNLDSLDFLQAKQQELWALEDANREENKHRRIQDLYDVGYSVQEVESLLWLEDMERQSERNSQEVEMEQQKADAKMSILMEYMSWVEGTGSILAGLAKKDTALAIAALAMQKGAAIANIVIKTSAANAEISSNSAKASAKAMSAGKASILGGLALMGNPGTAIIGAAMQTAGTAAMTGAAAIKAGAATSIAKNNVGAGISIAKIAATTLTSALSPSGGGGSGGSGGGGSSTFTPSFNVVGNSGENQLAQSISGQVNSPTRAFVVYNDITEAGDIENNAVVSSGLG